MHAEFILRRNLPRTSNFILSLKISLYAILYVYALRWQIWCDNITNKLVKKGEFYINNNETSYIFFSCLLFNNIGF